MIRATLGLLLVVPVAVLSWVLLAWAVGPWPTVALIVATFAAVVAWRLKP
jgi:hypothetical protein